MTPPPGRAAHQRETGKETRAIPKTIRSMPDADGLLNLVEASLDDDKAEDIVVIDLKDKGSFADYMVIASGRSDRHVGAMADHLVENMKTAGLPSVPAEGTEQCDWVLLDGGDVVVHLFRPEVRSFYNLEKLWSDEAAAGDREARAEVLA